MATTKLMTAEDLWQMGDLDGHVDLIRGELHQMAPAGGLHGEVGFNIHGPLWVHVTQRGLGRVYNAETGFILARNPDTVLVPDVSFVRTERLPERRDRVRFLQIAPDLVVDVVSPSDRAREVAEKVRLCLEAGVRLVWKVEERPRTVTAYAANGTVRVLGEGDELDGGDVLPGFRLAIADVFR